MKIKDKDSRQLEEAFYEGVIQRLMHSPPSLDGQGHQISIRSNITRELHDGICALRNELPEGWEKTQASWLRTLLSIGLYAVKELLEKMERDGELEFKKADQLKMLMSCWEQLNEGNTEARSLEVKRELGKIKGNLLKQEVIKNIKLIDILWTKNEAILKGVKEKK